MNKDILDKSGNLIAQVYNINEASTSMFPTPDNVTFQFGVGVITDDKVYKTHMHKKAERQVETTSEFLYVVSGLMTVDILDLDEKIVETVGLKDNMGLLQFYGGHAIRVKAGTKYFELKQGPYKGRDFDKYDVEDGT